MKQAMAIGARRMMIADQPHRDVEDALDRRLQRVGRLGRVGEQQADAEDQSEEHHREDVVVGGGGDDVVGDDREDGVDALRLVGLAAEDRPGPFARVGEQLAAASAWSTPAPGWNRLMTASASTTAMPDTTMVKTRVLRPTRFSERMSPISAMPTTSAENSKGMTSMNSRRRKIWPIGPVT